MFYELTAKTGMEKKNNVPEARSEPGHSIHTVLVTGYATVWGGEGEGVTGESVIKLIFVIFLVICC